MIDMQVSKPAIRKQLQAKLAAMSPADRHAKSVAICTTIAASPEFQSARVVMIYLSTIEEVDTAPLALRAWQAGKTVVGAQSVVGPAANAAGRNLVP